MNTTLIKVAGKSNVSSVAGSIVKSITEDNHEVILNAIGAGAVNQSMKALASARGILASKGIDLLVKPGFSEITISGEERTIMTFKVVTTR